MKRLALALALLLCGWIYFRFFFVPPAGLALTDAILYALLAPVASGDLPSLSQENASFNFWVSVVMSPGLFVGDILGFHPVSSVSGGSVVLPGATRGSGFLLFGFFLLSWWMWAFGIRMALLIPARLIGFYDPGEFHKTLWWWPWRWAYRLVLIARRWVHQFIFGKKATAKWAGALETLTLIFKPGNSIFLGRMWAFGIRFFQPIGIEGSRHVAMIAASGAGKTVQLMTMLGTMHAKASAFVIDCDGQMVNALGESLTSEGHKVVLLDPYKLARHQGGSWNALAEIDAGVKRHGLKEAVRFADTLAEGLIKPEGNPANDWVSKGARQFLKGLLLYVWLVERARPEQRNLVRVYELLTRGLREKVREANEDPFDVLLFEMSEAPETIDDGLNGAICAVIAAAADVMRTNRGSDGKNPPKGACIENLSWVEFLADISRESDFVGEDLKTGNICLFICAPLTDIQNKLSGWVRALTVMTMYAFQNITDFELGIPALFVIDEMPSLGRIEVLGTAAPGFRKYGARLVTVAQDIEQLKKAYPQEWSGFLNNSECVIWMGISEPESLNYLVAALGKHTHAEAIKAGILSGVDARVQQTERDLIYAHQLKEFLEPSRKQIIVWRSDGRPLRLGHAPYYTELPVSACGPDPRYGEKPMRALGRKIYSAINRSDRNA